MQFDTVIIGGGLAGLICGIRLQKAGHKTAIISAGQSVMHFSSGTFDLLNRMPDGTPVENPLKAIDALPETHPYKKIGAANVMKYAAEVKDIFAGCGVKLNGQSDKNSYRITPVGEIKPCWLSFEDISLLASEDEIVGKKALIANFLGYLDFNTKFISSALEDRGTKCHVVGIKTDAIEKLRRNPTEMRSSNIARAMDTEENWKDFVKAVKERITDEDVIVLPAVFGLKNRTVVDNIKKELGVKTIFVATMPPSVPGIRTQMQLKNAYIELGGEFILGDTVSSATLSANNSDGNEHSVKGEAETKELKVVSINTVNFEEIAVKANNFVLASGSFFSNGLIADPYTIKEPVFGLDLDYKTERKDWYDVRFFNKQEYFKFGVKTNNNFQTSLGGQNISNLWAAGSILSGTNALYEGCGGGTAIISALYVADQIAK